MSTVTIRPNSTVNASTGLTVVGAASQHAALSDNSDSSYIANTGVQSYKASAYGFPSPGLSNNKISRARFHYRGYEAGAEQIALPLWSPITFAPWSGSSIGNELPGTLGTVDGTWLTQEPWDDVPWVDSHFTTYSFNLAWPNQANAGDVTRLYDVWIEIEYYATVGTPTGVTPSAAQTLPNPTLGATLVASSDSQLQTAEWQIASDTGFTSNVKTISGVTSVASGAVLRTTTTSELDLAAGTWYIRCRGKDQYGFYGAWSSYSTFTVSHGSTAINQSPTGGGVLLYAATNRLSWSFSDPSPTDSQTAYQVIVEKVSDGSSIADTGKVTSTNQYADIAIGAANKDISLRWKVRTYDLNDETAGYTNYHIFRVSDAPTVTVTSPTASEEIASGKPTVTWSVGGNATQQKRQITIRRTSDSALIYQTALETTTSLTWTASTTILENLEGYTVTVTVVDTENLTGEGTQNFTTSFAGPPTVTFTVDGSGYDTLGYVELDWSQFQEDSEWMQWRVYRRRTGETDWTLLASFSDVTVVTYHDWSAAAGDYFEYAVTQIATRFGTPIEGATVASTSVLADSTHYWLVNPNDETYNLRLDQVVSDDYSDEYDEQAINLIGRGRKYNQGTRFGYTGSLVAQLRTDSTLTARQKRQKLQSIKDQKVQLYLRNPFGDYLMIALGNLQFSRISGVGTSEFVDVTVPYYEVS